MALEGKPTAGAFIIKKGTVSIYKYRNPESITQWKLSSILKSKKSKNPSQKSIEEDKKLDRLQAACKNQMNNYELIGYIESNEICCIESLFNKDSLSLFSLRVESENLTVYDLSKKAIKDFFNQEIMD